MNKNLTWGTSYWYDWDCDLKIFESMSRNEVLRHCQWNIWRVDFPIWAENFSIFNLYDPAAIKLQQ